MAIKVWLEVYVFAGNRASAVFRREALLPAVPQIRSKVNVGSGDVLIQEITIWAITKESPEGCVLGIGTERHSWEAGYLGHQTLGAFLRLFEERYEGWQRTNVSSEWIRALADQRV